MIKKAIEKDISKIYTIINDAAFAYKGIIPKDRWHEPYMPVNELKKQIAEGVIFYCYFLEGKITGVMGIQNKIDVNLIRHAYVLTHKRNTGIGSKLLDYLKSIDTKPILVGTWKAATWAVKFYQKHGFSLVPDHEKNILLRKYWSIPERQVETSVVLANNSFSFHNDSK